MSTYRVEWSCCGSVTETESWEPEHCPFCHAPPQPVAAAAAEPVAWCSLTPSGSIEYLDGKPMVMPGKSGNEHHTTPLYTRPAAVAEPVAYMHEWKPNAGIIGKSLQWRGVSPHGDDMQVRPLYAAPPQREPVFCACGDEIVPDDEARCGTCVATKLQREREPLTDEQVDDLSREMVKGGKSVNWLCRAIERAHGISAPASAPKEAP